MTVGATLSISPRASRYHDPDSTPTELGSIVVRVRSSYETFLFLPLDAFLSRRQARRTSLWESAEDKSIIRDTIAIVFATSVPESRSLRSEGVTADTTES